MYIVMSAMKLSRHHQVNALAIHGMSVFQDTIIQETDAKVTKPLCERDEYKPPPPLEWGARLGSVSCLSCRDEAV